MQTEFMLYKKEALGVIAKVAYHVCLQQWFPTGLPCEAARGASRFHILYNNSSSTSFRGAAKYLHNIT